MKKIYLVLVALFASVGQPSYGAKPSHEAWKGASSANEFTAGVMGGMAIDGSNVGGVLLGNVAKKIINRGFAPDINDQVFLEVQAGPEFYSGATVFGLSTHLRWD